MTPAGERFGDKSAAEGWAARPGAATVVLDVLVGAVAIVSLGRIWVQGIEPRPALTALALAATLPLLARRRFPFTAPLAALGGCVGLSLVLPGALWEQLQFFFAALFCSWVLGSENPRPRALIGLAAALGVAVGTVATDPTHHGVGDYVFGVAITAAAWTGGLLFGGQARQATAAERRARQLAAERERRAAEAVAAERARIARELHDVIAHTVVQAGAAEQVLGPGNEQARAALTAIRDSGKGALVELRRLLGLLRDDQTGTSPIAQPSLSQVDQLVAALAAAGADVELTTTGTPRALSPGLDQTSYRIIQEALTNTLKHAGPAHAEVRICWEPDALVLTVTDNGRGAASGANGAGRGIVGMRERAQLYGGQLQAGPRLDGGFAVTARIPA